MNALRTHPRRVGADDIAPGDAEGSIDIPKLQGAVTMTNLNEDEIADVPWVSGEVLLAARTNEIVTLRFRRA